VAAIALTGDEIGLEPSPSRSASLRAWDWEKDSSMVWRVQVRWGCAALFEPVEAVAMALSVDEIELAVVIDVIAEDGEAGVAEIPVAVPLPLVVVGVDVLEPAKGGEDVGLAVAVDVGDADAVTVLMFAADVMDPGLGSGKSIQRMPEWL
jgi:hypothetical protein